MQEAVKGVTGLEIRQDSVEDLVLTETKREEGRGVLRVTGVCLGKECTCIR